MPLPLAAMCFCTLECQVVADANPAPDCYWWLLHLGPDFDWRIPVQVRNITIIECFAPTEISVIVERIFYEQLHAVQKKLPKDNIVNVVGDLNPKMGIERILLRY